MDNLRIDFYYWGMQCPLNHEMVKLLEQFKDDFNIVLHDVDKNAELVVQQRMFFPFLTVVDNKMRFFSPITRQFLMQLLNGEVIEEKPYIIQLARERYKGEIVPLTRENIHVAGKCTGREHATACRMKVDFLSNHFDGIYGYLNIENGDLLGGAEYIPSKLVPYNVPKDDKYAFLTCLYLSSSNYDYKALPLQALEVHLKKHYDKIIAISDELGVFPNGNLKWFLEQGYQDEGIISVEHNYCTLHLVSKYL